MDARGYQMQWSTYRERMEIWNYDDPPPTNIIRCHHPLRNHKCKGDAEKVEFHIYCFTGFPGLTLQNRFNIPDSP